jgi:hypothetical protein
MNLDCLLDRLGIDPGEHSDLHLVRMFSCFVAVSNRRVTVLSDPVMSYCPLARRLYRHLGIPPHPPVGPAKDLVRRSVEEKIESLGFFTPCRKLQQRSIAIPYGASEILMHALRKRTIDAAMVACEGAGSVITDAP